MKTKEVDTQLLISGKSRPYRSILIFGPPGAGKGTLGKFLSSTGNHFHLSSGEIFRGLSPESPAGKLYHSYAGKGHLLPDDVTIGIWHHFVEGLIATNRYFPHQQLLLLDGIPRTLHQAQQLDQYIQVMHIIVLETQNVDELIKRMKRRAMIERRADDFDEMVLQTRMRVYAEDTHQLLEHYPSKLISRFKADQRPLEVLRDVLGKLSDLLSHSEESYL
ncbi:MAG TPA: nucleoside monophosphate kinase [Candidatus Babeliaceae bacterium]|nr:nucleoside monophosphate kinase [Candidatus Babeliaceae bacterium]